MAVLNQRHGAYKGGLGLFVLGTVMFIVGFATPNWCDYTFRLGVTGFGDADYVRKGHAGLWSSCYKGTFGESHCEDGDSTTGWMQAVKGLQCTALAILILGGLYGMYINLLDSKPSINRLWDIATGLAVVLGLSGAITYGVKSHQDADFLNSLPGNHDFEFSLSWSFGVSISACILLMLAAILLGRFNQPLDMPPATTFSNLNTTGMPMTAVPATGYVYSIPPANPNGLPSTAPPTYYPSMPGQGQAQGQAQGYAQGQGQVFDMPVVMTKH